MPPVIDAKKILPYAGVTANDIEAAKSLQRYRLLADGEPHDQEADSECWQMVSRMVKRQTVVRQLLERCMEHHVEIPDGLVSLLDTVNDVHELRQMSKRSFETLMFEVRTEVSKKLK